MKKLFVITALILLTSHAHAVEMPKFFQKDKKAAENKSSEKEPAKTVVKPVAVKPADKTASVAQKSLPASGKPTAPSQNKTANQKSEPLKKPTREEMVQRIKNIISGRQNILSTIQGLEAKQEGNVTVYLYNGKKIEDLDEEALAKLHSMVNQQVSLDNLQMFDRQQRQLRNLQQIEQINKTQRTLRDQQALSRSQTPRIYTPPKIPKTRY